MIKQFLKSTAALTLVIMMMCTALLGVVFAAEPAVTSDEPTVEIFSKNVSYGEFYHIMFAVKATNVPEGADVRLLLTKGGKNIETTVTRETVKDVEDAYVFMANSGVAAYDIDEQYTAVAQITDGDTVIAESAVSTYSILEYLYERLFVSKNSTDKQKEFYKSFLHFAELSEGMFEGQPESIADTCYVAVVGGNISGGSQGILCKRGDEISGFYHSDVESGSLIWNVSEYASVSGEPSVTEYESTELSSVVVNNRFTILSAAEPATPTWQLLTDASELVAGAKIIIAAKDFDYAISMTQQTNNRGASAITKNADGTITPASNTQIITIEAGNTEGTFALKTEAGYLYAASSSSNYLRSENKLTNNSSWSITIDASGVASVRARGSYTRNLMRFNNSSTPLFSCYSTGQSDICIYILK